MRAPMKIPPIAITKPTHSESSFVTPNGDALVFDDGGTDASANESSSVEPDDVAAVEDSACAAASSTTAASLAIASKIRLYPAPPWPHPASSSTPVSTRGMVGPCSTTTSSSATTNEEASPAGSSS